MVPMPTWAIWATWTIRGDDKPMDDMDDDEGEVLDEVDLLDEEGNC